MSPLRTRTLHLAVTSSLLVAALWGGPAAAADDPEAAVDAFVEAVSSRELTDLDGIVCTSQQEALQAAFSDGGLGLDLMADSFSTIAVSIDDLEVEVIAADDETAQADLRGTLTIDVDDEQLRGLTLELIEAGAGPDDAPATDADIDADIDAALPIVTGMLGLEQPIDAAVTLVFEDGEWVVCSHFAPQRDGLDELTEGAAMISSDGLCALARPAELSQLGPLEYDSSTGIDEFCTYSRSDWDAFHAATIGILPMTTLDDWREAYVPDRELEVGGAAAFGSGATVFTQAGRDVLQVTVSLPELSAVDVDAEVQAVAISELFLPRLSQLVTAGPEPEPEPEPAGPSLCEASSLAELNTASGRAFDRAEGGSDYCTWVSSDPGAGLDMVVAIVTDLTLDEFGEVLGVTEPGEVDGIATIKTTDRAIVELPDGRTLDVSVSYDETMAPSVPAGSLALTMAQRLLPKVAPRTDTEPGGGGLLAGRDHVDDICRAVPFEELSAISGVTFEDPIFGGDLCEYSGSDGAGGWHYAATSLDRLPLSAWLDDDPEMTSFEIDGHPALVATNPFDDEDSSALAVVAVPGFEELTFSAYVAIDSSTSTEVDAAAMAQAMAALGLSRLLTSTD